MTTTPIVVPDHATNCRNCKVFMPIAGVVTVSASDPSLCSDCAGDGNEKGNRRLHMTRVNENQIDRARVQAWAAWRREGKSHDDITALDTLQPSYPTIKKYLNQYGFDGDGQPVQSSNGATPKPLETPDGWGQVESGVLDPTLRHGTDYIKMLRIVVRTVTGDWQRIAAPSAYRARKLSELVREQRQDIERRVREVNGITYFYFRLKQGDGAE